jgi:alcohol dehydrogenase class IV
MTRFEFATVSKIIFGEGVFGEAAILASQMGQRILVVSGFKGDYVNTFCHKLKALGCDSFLFDVVSEPTVASIMLGIEYVHLNLCNVVVSLGGGSSIDTGKVIAVMATNPGMMLDYMEVIGKGKQLQLPGLPFVAVPTTAGTGAEVTRNAVVASPEHGVKVSLRSSHMLPKAAIIDPELTYGLPPDVTAFTGMDALTQLIEPFVSVAANPMTDGLCKEGIQRAAQSLQAVYLHGQDTLNRRNMALASLFGGLALANAKLGAVHGFAGPIGGMFSIPHGAICARLLPIVMDVNLRALRERQPSDPIINRYHEIAQLITGNAKAEDVEGVRWIEELSLALQIPPLSEFGFTRESIPVIVDLSAQSSSMKGNPIQLNRDEMVEILERAL